MCFVGRVLTRPAEPENHDWNTPCLRRAIHQVPMEELLCTHGPVLLCDHHLDVVYRMFDAAGLIDHDVLWFP